MTALTRRAGLGLLAAAPALLPLRAAAEAAADRTEVELANLAVLERYHQEVWVEKKTDAILTAMSADFLSHSNPPDAPRGPEPVKAFIDAFFAAFPDMASETMMNLVDGDHVVTAWRLTGTQTGTLFGIAPTNRPIDVSGVDILRIAEGRFAEHWFGMGLVFPQVFTQLGVEPK